MSKQRLHVGKITIHSKVPGKSGPNFDPYITSCSPGEKRHGTAVLLTQNFVCWNLWHAFVQFQTIWEMIHIADPDDHRKERMQFFYQGKEVFQSGSFPQWVSLLRDAFERPATEPTSAASRNDRCFRRLLWAETHKGWPGTMWGLAHADTQTVKSCISCDPTMKRNFLAFQHDMLASALHNKTQTPDPPNVPLHLCYISRVGRTSRYFTAQMEKVFQIELSAWAAARGNTKFSALHFTSEVPVQQQVETVTTCNVLLGIHGAGLMHEMWMVAQPGKITAVVEIDERKPAEACKSKKRTYYANIASLLGHNYKCVPAGQSKNAVIKGSRIENMHLPAVLSALNSVIHS